MNSVLSGDWKPLQKAHQVLREYFNHLCQGNQSYSKLEEIVNEIFESSLNQDINDDELPLVTHYKLHFWTITKELKAKIKPGYNLSILVLATIRKHIFKLIYEILSEVAPSESNPTPFAKGVKDWAIKFVEELLTTLSPALNGNFDEVIKIIVWFVKEVSNFFYHFIKEMIF